MITFVLVAIFRKSDDSNDEEEDHEDDGGPLYIDEKIGSIHNINNFEVLNYIKLKF